MSLTMSHCVLCMYVSVVCVCVQACTFGGSVVILMPACRIVIGNSGCGEELSQSLKFGWGFSTCSCSTSLSSSGIQERERWQLARKTQWPEERKRELSYKCNDGWSSWQAIVIAATTTTCLSSETVIGRNDRSDRNRGKTRPVDETFLVWIWIMNLTGGQFLHTSIFKAKITWVYCSCHGYHKWP